MELSKRRGGGMWRAVGLSVVVLGIAASARGDVTVPNTFSAGTTISASQVNQNFAALATSMPAATNIYNYNSGNLSTTSIDIIGVTVTPPADGFFFVTGSAKFSITQTVAGSDTMVAGLQMSTGGPTTGSPEVRLALNTTGGTAQTLSSSLTASYVFSVTSGVATTFKMYAVKASGGGTGTASYLQPFMHVLFVPNQLPCIPAAGNSNYGLCQ